MKEKTLKGSPQFYIDQGSGNFLFEDSLQQATGNALAFAVQPLHGSSATPSRKLIHKGS